MPRGFWSEGLDTRGCKSQAGVCQSRSCQLMTKNIGSGSAQAAPRQPLACMWRRFKAHASTGRRPQQHASTSCKRMH